MNIQEIHKDDVYQKLNGFIVSYKAIHTQSATVEHTPGVVFVADTENALIEASIIAEQNIYMIYPITLYESHSVHIARDIKICSDDLGMLHYQVTVLRNEYTN